MIGSKKRQLRSMSPRLNVIPIAKEIANAIINHQENPWLQWSKKGGVKVLYSKALPEAPKQTMEGRHKRLTAAFEQRVSPAGWHRDRTWYRLAAKEGRGE